MGLRGGLRGAGAAEDGLIERFQAGEEVVQRCFDGGHAGDEDGEVVFDGGPDEHECHVPDCVALGEEAVDGEEAHDACDDDAGSGVSSTLF